MDAEAYVEEEREPEVKPKILLMGPKRYAAHILMITSTANSVKISPAEPLERVSFPHPVTSVSCSPYSRVRI